MNQEVEQEGATSSSRAGYWGRRCRREDLTGYDNIDQFNDVVSTEDASTVSTSEYRRTAPPPPAAPVKAAGTSYGGSGAPCGACKFLRRKCATDCVFAPYFGDDTPYFGEENGATRFAAVHKIFGASNVGKLLQSIPVHQRFHAVLTISHEAKARIRNPVYGCVADIVDLQQQVQSLQTELSFVHAQLAKCRHVATMSCMALQQQQQQQQQQQGGHTGTFLPFEQSQPIDPIHMQQLLSYRISSPLTTTSYNNTIKEEIGNPLQGNPNIYGNVSMGMPSTPSLASSHMQPADSEHHQLHASLDLTEKNDDILSHTSSDTSQLHTHFRTTCLNLHETSKGLP